VRLKAEEALKENCRHDRCNISTTFWNRIIGGIKRRIRASQHFRSFWGAWRTIAGYERQHGPVADHVKSTFALC
jgi:hypothetical protein